MSPRTQEQFEKLRENKKELIRSKALKLFAKQGYYATSISMISNEANISKGLLYNYYSSKEALLKDIIINGFQTIMETIDPDQDGVITEDELISMIRINRDLIKKDLKFWKLYFSILVQPSVMDIVKPEITNFYNSAISMFSDYFRRNNYEDPETEALFLGSIMDGVGFQYIFNPRDYPIDKITERIINIYRKNK